MPDKKGRPTLFIDRDGTLIHERPYLGDPDKVKLFADVPDALKRLQQAGFYLVVVSNQSGVARGRITVAQLMAVRKRFLELLKAQHVVVDGYYWCPHGPHAGCQCRKPRSGLLRQAARELKIEWRGGISIGDKPSDVQLAQRAQGQGILVKTGHGRRLLKSWKGRRPDYIANDFSAAARWILSHIRKDGSWISSDPLSVNLRQRTSNSGTKKIKLA